MVTLTLQGCSLGTSTSTQTVTTGTEQTSMETSTLNTGSNELNTDTGSQSTGTAVEVNTTVESNTTALNGTFHLTSTYMSPAGEEPMDATVTLKDNVITAVEAKNVAHAPMSKNFQDKFAAGIAGQIVGKNIEDVQVTYVNGSSLTAKAFNKALHELEAN